MKFLSPALNRLTANGHQMYFGGSVVGKASFLP